MGKSIQEIHLEFVERLKERGETILQPKSNPMSGNPQGYIKSQIPHKYAGAIFMDKEGTFGLFGDFGATHVTGIEWEDLGLCDSRCWYEWIDNRIENKEEEKRINDKLKLAITKIDETVIELDNLKNELVTIKNNYLKVLMVK